ncbi:hypothetical protein NQ314_021154 [Rhamnusium bicolor]|uniref:Uncharacterized protein n=1 Tax=Rhamnusium bicolor TaxID=1586634 RepID=A0AAV8WIW6_9CUCU|nr:hypothetical protein NQ314_021154 [Rhamnusium bicolor]
MEEELARYTIEDKKRKVDQVKYSAGTGGGPSYPDQLTDTDEKILSTMSVVEILGNQDVNETEINFEYENESTPSFNIEYDTDIPLEIHELQAIQPNVEESHIDIPKDHIYCTKTNSQIPVTKGSNKENEAKKKRTVASQRLKDSTIASKALVEIAKEKLEIKKNTTLRSYVYWKDKFLR